MLNTVEIFALCDVIHHKLNKNVLCFVCFFFCARFFELAEVIQITGEIQPQNIISSKCKRWIVFFARWMMRLKLARLGGKQKRREWNPWIPVFDAFNMNFIVSLVTAHFRWIKIKWFEIGIKYFWWICFKALLLWRVYFIAAREIHTNLSLSYWKCSSAFLPLGLITRTHQKKRAR